MTMPPSTQPSDLHRSVGQLLDVRAVAAALGCSTRNVYRLADAGKMPPPIKLGTLVRWRAAEIEIWIADGCPPCRTGRG